MVTITSGDGFPPDCLLRHPPPLPYQLETSLNAPIALPVTSYCVVVGDLSKLGLTFRRRSPVSTVKLKPKEYSCMYNFYSKTVRLVFGGISSRFAVLQSANVYKSVRQRLEVGVRSKIPTP